MTGYIYFIQASDNGPVKIGSTAHDPRRRMAKIQSDCPWPITLLGAIKGSVSLEKQFHLLLSRWRTQGEWFKPHPTVMAAVSEALSSGRAIASAPPSPKNALELYLRDSGESLSAFAVKINRSPSTLTRVLSGERNPSMELVRAVEAGTSGRVSATEFISICLSASASEVAA